MHKKIFKNFVLYFFFYPVNSAHEQCPNSDLNSVQVTTSHWPTQVATSKWGHDPKFNRPGRDANPMSRPASAPPPEVPLSRPKTLVETPNHHKAARTMSRHQIGVATPFLLPSPKLGRNANPMSRLQFPIGQVATLVPCRDLLDTNLCRDINFMSRPRFYPQWDFQVATLKSMSRPPTLLPMSRPKK